jgi:DNA-binding GntR family transcriptional regulator
MVLLDEAAGPLRGALQLLEDDARVAIVPRAGICFVKPDMSRLKDNFQLRRILEMEAVRKYAEVAQAEELKWWNAAHREVLAAARSKMA